MHSLSGILLSSQRLENSLSDPLYPGYISRAASSQLLPPFDVLGRLSEIILNLQPGQETARYPLLRIISQAITLWKPSSSSAGQVHLLWNIEQILHQFIEQENLAQDHVLFIESMDAWKTFLASKSIRPLLKAEKKKKSGIYNYDLSEFR
jgi:hypothetical protein